MGSSADNFLKNVNRELERLGWSQAKLAERIDIAPQLLSRYLTAKTTPGLDMIDAVAKALSVSPSILISRSPRIPEARVIQPTVMSSAMHLGEKIKQLEEITKELKIYSIQSIVEHLDQLEKRIDAIESSTGNHSDEDYGR